MSLRYLIGVVIILAIVDLYLRYENSTTIKNDEERENSTSQPTPYDRETIVIWNKALAEWDIATNQSRATSVDEKTLIYDRRLEPVVDRTNLIRTIFIIKNGTNKHRRNVLRSTWLSQLQANMTYVFCVKKKSNLVLVENFIFNDILYMNLTELRNSTTAWMKFMLDNYPEANTYVEIDYNIILDPNWLFCRIKELGNGVDSIIVINVV